MPGPDDFAIRITADDGFTPTFARARRALGDLQQLARQGFDLRGHAAALAGAGLARTAAAIGVSPRDLQRWMGAGEYVGLPPDATAASLAAIGEKLHEGAYGRDEKAFNALNDPRFNLGPVCNPDGSIRSSTS